MGSLFIESSINKIGLPNRWKIFVELVVYVLFSWFSLSLLSNLGLRLVDVFNLEIYLTLFREKILSLFLILISLGIATSILFIALRQVQKKRVVLVSLISSIIALVPMFLLVTEERVLYAFVAAFYVLGIVFVAYKIHDKKEDTFFHSFDIGWHALRKVFYIMAVGAFIGSLVFVSSNPATFEDSFTDMVVSSIESPNSFSITKDQIKSMLENQMDPSLFVMEKPELRTIVKSTTPEMTEDLMISLSYPDFDSYPQDQQNLIRAEISSYLNSETYKTNLDASVDEQVDAMYDRMNDPIYQEELKMQMMVSMDSTVDRIHEKMNSGDYRKGLAESAKSMIDTMPIVKKMYDFMPIIVAITIFSVIIFVELISSFIGGLVFVVHFLFFYRKDKVVTRKDDIDKRISKHLKDTSLDRIDIDEFTRNL